MISYQKLKTRNYFINVCNHNENKWNNIYDDVLSYIYKNHYHYDVYTYKNHCRVYLSTNRYGAHIYKNHYDASNSHYSNSFLYLPSNKRYIILCFNRKSACLLTYINFFVPLVYVASALDLVLLIFAKYVAYY